MPTRQTKLILISASILLVFSCGKSPQALYQLGQDYVNEQQYDLALEQFQSLVASYPEDSLTPPTQYKIARIYLERKDDYGQGLNLLKQVFADYPNTPEAKQAQKDVSEFNDWLFDRAESKRNAKNINESLDILEYLVKSPSNIEIVAKAQYLIGDIHMNDLRDFNHAIEAYQKITWEYRGTKQEAHAQFMIGYIYANILHDIENAKKEYEIFLKQFPHHELAPSVKFEIEFLGKDINEIAPLKHITS